MRSRGSATLGSDSRRPRRPPRSRPTSAAFDLRLNPGSAAINAGAPASFPATDVFGNRRGRWLTSRTLAPPRKSAGRLATVGLPDRRGEPMSSALPAVVDPLRLGSRAAGTAGRPWACAEDAELVASPELPLVCPSYARDREPPRQGVLRADGRRAPDPADRLDSDLRIGPRAGARARAEARE